MPDEKGKDHRFGAIAMELNLVDQGKVNKALVVQKRILEKTGVRMPVGEILVEMGAISTEQCEDILQMQREFDDSATDAEKAGRLTSKGKKAPEEKKKEAGIEIFVSKDKLTVTASFGGVVPDDDLDINDVKIMLHNKGIIYGIVDDSRISAFLSGKVDAGEPWVIAAGLQPVPDAPPEIKYHFDTNPMKIGTLTEDGLMDWKNRGQLPQVKEGVLLAEKIQGPKGKEGMDVFGKKIPIPKARDIRFKTGKGAKRSEDGMQVHASLAGMPKLTADGEISVLPTLLIQGDIALETGHVEFDGHVEVEGIIEKGYRVKAGSLRATEIQAADIDIAGDITAMNGIFGATIRGMGNLKAGHINNASIFISGDIAVEREIIDSTIEANGRCLINNGIVIGSTVSAKMGITTMDVGTEASRSSDLTVGIDRRLEREAASIKARIQPLKTEQESLLEEISALKARSDEINTRLGEVAQEQDRCMVQHRQLQEKVEAAPMAADRQRSERLTTALQELKTRQENYDLDVARLMEEDETIGEQIAEIRAAVEDHERTIATLTEQLNVVTELQKSSTGLAVVKIAGSVFSGTRIQGPHAKLVFKEDLKRLCVTETDSPDHDGARRWRFELTPFR